MSGSHIRRRLNLASSGASCGVCAAFERLRQALVRIGIHDQTLRPLSSTHTPRFQPRQHSNSLISVWLEELKEKDRVFISGCTSRGPPSKKGVSHNLEQISTVTIAHHTEYDTTIITLNEAHVSQRQTLSYLVGPPSRLVDRPLFGPLLPEVISTLISSQNSPNGAISVMHTFNRIIFHLLCNCRYLVLLKAKSGDREIIVLTATLSTRCCSEDLLRTTVTTQALLQRLKLCKQGRDLQAL